jgi:hypothetical protein
MPTAAMIDYSGDIIDILEYWPSTKAKKDFPDVPAPIAATASEAHKDL